MIISLYSMKGGVGKTSAAVNLAYLSAKEGFNTLLCDLDPQGASTYYFRIKASKDFNTKKLLKGGKNLDGNIKATDYENLDLLPSKLSLRNMDLELDSHKNSKTRFNSIVKELSKEYEIIFMDCPPGITLLSENIFNSSDMILVPLIPTTLSIRTYEKLIKFFKKEKLDRSKIYAFFSMVEIRKSMHRDTITKMSQEIKNLLYSQIPYRSNVEKMGIYRKPVNDFEPFSPAAFAYSTLWNEIKEVE
ncbi:MAG TPA: AAA family ATPase [Thermodesulfobacteriota bacterium]|nr:AAA family ATPase [Thermodesulfobacteriota bacterium]